MLPRALSRVDECPLIPFVTMYNRSHGLSFIIELLTVIARS